MKEFLEEFIYMCSSSNTKSRGFYIFIALVWALLLLGGTGTIVLCVITAVKGWFQLYYLFLTAITWICFIGLTVWLKKS